MTRVIDPEHPFVEVIVAQMSEVKEDGTLSDIAMGHLASELAGHGPDALADALWHALVFASFLDTKLGAEASAAQLLEFVEIQANRLPVDARAALDGAKAAARVTGAESSLLPVGSKPEPGSLRGPLAARFASKKAP